MFCSDRSCYKNRGQEHVKQFWCRDLKNGEFPFLVLGTSSACLWEKFYPAVRPFRGTGLGSSSYVTTLVNTAVWKTHVTRGLIGPGRCTWDCCADTGMERHMDTSWAGQLDWAVRPRWIPVCFRNPCRDPQWSALFGACSFYGISAWFLPLSSHPQ